MAMNEHGLQCLMINVGPYTHKHRHSPVVVLCDDPLVLVAEIDILQVPDTFF